MAGMIGHVDGDGRPVLGAPTLKLTLALLPESLAPRDAGFFPWDGSPDGC